jgi:hypothetical protein
MSHSNINPTLQHSEKDSALAIRLIHEIILLSWCLIALFASCFLAYTLYVCNTMLGCKHSVSCMQPMHAQAHARNLQSAQESCLTKYYYQHISQQHKFKHLHLELQSAQESWLIRTRFERPCQKRSLTYSSRYFPNMTHAYIHWNSQAHAKRLSRRAQSASFPSWFLDTAHT